MEKLGGKFAEKSRKSFGDFVDKSVLHILAKSFARERGVWWKVLRVVLHTIFSL